jgi:hypothetical protein
MPYTAAAFCWLISAHNLKRKNGLYYFNKFITDLNTKGWDRATGLGTPMLNKFIGKLPIEEPAPEPEPGPGTEPEPDPKPNPTREQRKLIFTFFGNYSIVWKNQNETKLHKLTVLEINVAITTTGSAEQAHDELEKAVEWFFKNRGLILSVTRNNMTAEDLTRSFAFSKQVKRRSPYMELFTSTNKDFSDAAYWTRRFFEVIIKKQKGLDVKAMQMICLDEAKRQTIIIL